MDKAKKFYVLKIKGYEATKLCACTLLFEGNKLEMEAKHKEIMELSKKFNGMAGGAENGLRGYLLTFLIAYTRDLGLTYGVAAESFETSCSW
jgi:alkyldihydroxyacetonephosphate synthase